MLAPILGLITLMVKLGSPGPVFYLQKRLGKHGKVFEMLKFRTMYLNADQMLALYLAQNPEMKAEWNCHQKLVRDPRITPVGTLLRRFSLDELPQLWNVLVGDMSLVGPRPIMLGQRELYGENFQHYVRTQPGLTGLWQVSGRSDTSYADRVALDEYYVRHWSIWMDLYILFRTVWVVIKHSGAY
jgi:Undecaprenyl-phosphate galactose phosphotransferase WbaP